MVASRSEVGSSPVKEYDRVRVRRLIGSGQRPHLGHRPPAVGDEGTIVDVSQKGGCTVESAADDGSMIWLADFHLEELEVISDRPGESS